MLTALLGQHAVMQRSIVSIIVMVIRVLSPVDQLVVKLIHASMLLLIVSLEWIALYVSFLLYIRKYPKIAYLHVYL